MKPALTRQILALIIFSILCTIECSNLRRPSLRLIVQPDPTSPGSNALGQVTFHLLNEDPIYLVMSGADEHKPQAAEVYSAHPKLRVLAGKLNARRFGAYSLGPDVFLFIDQSRPLWEPHVVRSVQTDVDPNLQLDDLKPGNYYLMAYRQAPDHEAFWLQYVTVKDGATEIFLERSNALYFKSPNSSPNPTNALRNVPNY